MWFLKNLWRNILFLFLFHSDLTMGVKLWPLFGLVPTFLFLVHPLWKQSGFLHGLSYVHTRGSEKNKGKISPLSLPGLATGVSTTLPRGWNMVSTLFDALFWSDDDTQFMSCQSTMDFICLKTIALILLKICSILHDNSGKYFVLHAILCKCSYLHASICLLLTELLITHLIST